MLPNVFYNFNKYIYDEADFTAPLRQSLNVCFFVLCFFLLFSSYYDINDGVGVPRPQKLSPPPPPPPAPHPTPWFLLSNSVVGESIALHATPADRASNYLGSAFPIPSTSFPPNLLQSLTLTVECVINSESEVGLVVAIHFVSTWYDPEWA